MTTSKDELNHLKLATEPTLADPIRRRWSPRAFSPRPVTAAQLHSILSAAQWSASSSNEQPWLFFVGIKGTPTWDALFASLAESNQSWAVNAGALILGVARATTAHSGRTNHFALYDLGQAAAQLAIQATFLGLAAHPMGGFDREAVRQAFHLTPDYLTGAIIAVGHQAEPAELQDNKYLDRELSPRTRKPLSEIALTALNTPFIFTD
jgi:nitroreductase